MSGRPSGRLPTVAEGAEVGRSPSLTSWTAHAAAAWAAGHAALSAYWAAGGTFGLSLLSEGIVELAQAREPWFVALVAGVAVAKAGAAALVLALVRPWGRVLPRRLVLVAVWLAGAAFTLYALAGLVPGLLAVLGVLQLPQPLDPALRWYLLVWYPLWLLGGVLYLAAAGAVSRARRRAARATGRAGAGVSPSPADGTRASARSVPWGRRSWWEVRR